MFFLERSKKRYERKETEPVSTIETTTPLKSLTLNFLKFLGVNLAFVPNPEPGSILLAEDIYYGLVVKTSSGEIKQINL